jgi:hypothetical protein
MRKTTVYLDQASVDGLRRLSAETGHAQAKLVREAIHRLIAQEPRRKFHSMGRGSSAGEDSQPRWSSDELYRKVMGRD